MEGTIQTQQENPALTTLLSSFQGRLAVTALQRAFPGDYPTSAAAAPSTTEVPSFRLMNLLPITLRLTLVCLQGGVSNI